MTLQIENAEVDELAKELARYTGETVPQAVLIALRERLERAKKAQRSSLAEELLRIGRECAALPVHDASTADEILGYDDHGVGV